MLVQDHIPKVKVRWLGARVRMGVSGGSAGGGEKVGSADAGAPGAAMPATLKATDLHVQDDARGRRGLGAAPHLQKQHMRPAQPPKHPPQHPQHPQHHTRSAPATSFLQDFFEKDCWKHHPKPHADYLEERKKLDAQLEADAKKQSVI